MGIQERKKREKEERRRIIISAAEHVFFLKEIQAATVDDVSEAAELSKGTQYLYFKNKEELSLIIWGEIHGVIAIASREENCKQFQQFCTFDLKSIVTATIDTIMNGIATSKEQQVICYQKKYPCQ